MSDDFMQVFEDWVPRPDGTYYNPVTEQVMDENGNIIESGKPSDDREIDITEY